MSETENKAVKYQTKGNVALLLMQNPPVNALSKSVRVGLIENLKVAMDDDSVKAIVISSELALFSGGADISEFSGGILNHLCRPFWM